MSVEKKNEWEGASPPALYILPALNPMAENYKEKSIKKGNIEERESKMCVNINEK